MVNKSIPKQKFRASLTFYFWLLNIITIPTYYFGGLITRETINFSSKYILFLIIGVAIGVFFGNGIKENTFKKLVINVLMILGMVSFASTLGIN